MPPNKNAAADGGDWRTSVQQSYRNTEVRQIARVLASLEPGASEASKLRLAMQFEDTMFREATSLADYHKRLSKRLKKLQKNYKPPADDANAATRQKEQAIQELIAKYGKTLKYVCENEVAAVKEMRRKEGEEKGKQLQVHMDRAKQWACALGLLPGDSSSSTKTQLNLEELQRGLDKWLDHIFSHVVKLVDPDLYLEEALQKCEREFKDKGRAVRVQAENCKKRYEQVQRASGSSSSASSTVDPATLLMPALGQVSRPVPILSSSRAAAAAATSRGAASTSKTANTNRNAPPNNTGNLPLVSDDRRKTALLHLDKMRAASTVVLAYMCTTDKYDVPRDTLVKAHRTANTGIEFVRETMRLHREQHQKTVKVRLEDAWLKPLVMPSKETTTTTDAAGLETTDGAADLKPPPPAAAAAAVQQPPSHRRRLYLRSRVLLTAGRKTPSNLVHALKAKNAKLIRPPPSGAGSHLHLEFEQAFTITIYLVPLLCELRAYDKNSNSSNAMDTTTDEKSAAEDSHLHACTWTPLHHGLSNRRGKEDELLTVGGTAQGTYETVGWAVQERLCDASAFATQALRSCFANSSIGSTASQHPTTTATNKAAMDFEVELLEASALLEFVQLARDTYMPSA